MKAERVVCDTNVLISAAILPEGRARKVVDHVLDHARLVISGPVFDELTSRLARTKFDRYLDTADRQAFQHMILLASDRVAITGAPQGCRDPDDDKVLETSIVGRADALVTGDADLLVLRPVVEGEAAQLNDTLFRDVAILRPSEFLRLIGEV